MTNPVSMEGELEAWRGLAAAARRVSAAAEATAAVLGDAAWDGGGWQIDRAAFRRREETVRRIDDLLDAARTAGLVRD